MTHLKFLVLVCIFVSPSSHASEPQKRYDATSRVSCGSFEGGAYHITVDTGDDVVLVYADDLSGDLAWTRGGDKELVVMSCEVDVRQCTLSNEASLKLQDRAFGRMDGVLTYEKSRMGTTTLEFRTKPRRQQKGTVCG